MVIRELYDHNGTVADLTWHRTNPYLLASVGTNDETLRLWDVRAHPAQISLRRTSRFFRRLQYSPDCSFIACGGDSIIIYDLQQPQTFVNIKCPSMVTSICFNPAECLLASASEDRLVRFWDVDTGECVTQSLPFESAIQQIEFEPSGKYLIIITSVQVYAISWEPYELLAQCAHSDFATQVLKTCIERERLLLLCSKRCAEELPNSCPSIEPIKFQIDLLSISLSQLEKCKSISKSQNAFTYSTDYILTDQTQHNNLFKNSLPIQKPNHLALNLNSPTEELRLTHRLSTGEETIPPTPSHSQHSFEETPASTMKKLNTTNLNRRASDTENDEAHKVESLILAGKKVNESIKKRKEELTYTLTNINTKGKSSNAAECIIDALSRHEEPHAFASLLHFYLSRPKMYSLGLNARFIDRIRLLFSFRRNPEYVCLAIGFLEMICASYGESIRHGLSAKSTIGVDVAADERYEKCVRCKNGLMQLRLNSAFLLEDLNETQTEAIQKILLTIDRITETTEQ